MTPVQPSHALREEADAQAWNTIHEILEERSGYEDTVETVQIALWKTLRAAVIAVFFLGAVQGLAREDARRAAMRGPELKAPPKLQIDRNEPLKLGLD